MSHGETHFKIPKQKKKKGYVLGIQKMRPSRDAFERIMVWYNSPDQLILYPMVNGISVRFQTVTEKHDICQSSYLVIYSISSP